MIFLFTGIDHPELLERRGTPEADHILACQFFLIEDTLFNHGVNWTQRTPTGVLAGFQGGETPDQASPAPKPEGEPQGRPAEAAIALLKDFQSHLWENFGKTKIRVVLHAGKAEAIGQTFVGPEFNHTLKLLEAAGSGQALLTVPAVHLIPLPPGSRLKDMGKHFLKDLSEPQNLYALIHSDLEAGNFEPPKSLHNYPQNFPPQTSPFYGREEELTEITGFLAQVTTRLITLIGPGGFGKTRLALQAAAEVIEKFKDGVFTVALAPLLSDELLLGSIANALKFFFYGAEDPKTQLLHHLKEKEILLVLDNFEHIIEGAELVAEILAAAPGVKILVTSRESLGLEGEKIIEVRGLRFPSDSQAKGFEASSAVQLFIKSASRFQPHFTLKPEDREPILAICRLLEGMPLGLELSATWVGTLPLPEIGEKIESSRDFLATAMPHLPPRHRSLRAVFEYSWILLAEPQKKVLKAISVFRSGFTGVAAKKVAGADEETLNYLSNKSLVRKRNGRYEVHELLKYYAKEKLYDQPEEKNAAMDAHSLYFSQWLQKKEKDLYGPNQKKAIEEMAEDIANIREGWKRAVEKHREKELDGYVDSLFTILEIKGWFQEGLETFREASQVFDPQTGDSKGVKESSPAFWAKLASRWAFFENILGGVEKSHHLYEQCLTALKSGSSLKSRGFSLMGLGLVEEAQGHYEKAGSLYEKSFLDFQKSGDRQGMAESLNHQAQIANHQGRHVQAQFCIKKSLALSGSDKDQRSTAHSHNLMGDTLHEVGSYEEARAHFQKGLSAYLEAGDRRGIAWSFTNLGREAEVLGDYAGARQMYQEAIALSRDMGDRRGVAWIQNLLGFLGWAAGDYPEANRFYQETLALYRQIGDLAGEAWTLDLLGNLRLAQREDREAENYYQQAYDLLSKEGLTDMNWAWYFYHMGALSSFRKDFPKAKEKFLKGLHYFEKREDPLGQSATLIQLGDIACQQGAYAESRRYFQKALRLALQSRLFPLLVDGFVGIAQLLKAEGDERQAISFLLVALAHPTCRRQTKDRVVTFSLDLQSQFSSEEMEGAVQWAKGARIEDVAASWVASHEKVAASRRKSPRSKPRKASKKTRKKTRKKK